MTFPCHNVSLLTMLAWRADEHSLSSITQGALAVSLNRRLRAYLMLGAYQQQSHETHRDEIK